MEVRSVEAVVKALNDADVQYLIVGGLAVNAHGYVRITRDIDLVLRLQPENCAKGLRALMKIGYQLAIPVTPESFSDPITRDSWRKDKNMIVLKLWSDDHRRTPVDVFVYEPFDFEKELPQASEKEVCAGVTARVVSLPTLLKMKKDAGRSQDLIDITELTRLP